MLVPQGCVISLVHGDVGGGGDDKINPFVGPRHLSFVTRDIAQRRGVFHCLGVGMVHCRVDLRCGDMGVGVADSWVCCWVVAEAAVVVVDYWVDSLVERSW